MGDFEFDGILFRGDEEQKPVRKSSFLSQIWTSILKTNDNDRIESKFLLTTAWNEMTLRFWQGEEFIKKTLGEREWTQLV